VAIDGLELDHITLSSSAQAGVIVYVNCSVCQVTFKLIECLSNIIQVTAIGNIIYNGISV
jgi:hypothetical protein